MDILLISVGLACLVVGVAGSVFRALNVEIPVLRAAAPNILLLELGITIAAVGFYLHYHHPPGASAGITVTADSIASYSSPCPVRIVVTGSVTISTGKGDVNYHAVLVSPDGVRINGRPLTAHFPDPGTQEISDTLNLVASTTPSNFTFYFQTDTPAREASNKQPFTVQCTE
jgi:hypothetical protein